MVRLADLLRDVPGEPFGDWNGVGVTGIALDSRRVGPGSLFAALPGAADHGATHLAEAVARGASALLLPAGLAPPAGAPGLAAADPRAALSGVCAAFFGHPSRQLAVIGVTGTNGKTTVTSMAAQILGRAGRPAGYWTTSEVDSGTRRFRPALTTPEGPDLHRWLREVADAGMRFACMEVSSHGVAQHRIDDVAFRAGVVTTVTPDHLDFHGTFAAYVEAKRDFVRRLPAQAICVHNADDPGACLVAEAARCGRRALVGCDPGADLRIEDASSSVAGARCTVSVRNPEALTPLRGVPAGAPATGPHAVLSGGAPESNAARNGDRGACGGPMPSRFPLAVPLPGRHNLSNALQALAVALALGVPLEDGLAALAAYAPPARRLHVTRVGGRTIIDDVAMNEAGFDTVLQTVAELAPSRVVAVTALRGNRGREINARIARALARWQGRLGFAPLIATLSRDALTRYALDYRVRREEVQAFLDAARAAAMPVDLHDDLEAAVAAAVDRLGSDGTLLLLGTFGMDDGCALACRLLGAEGGGQRFPAPTFG